MLEERILAKIDFNGVGGCWLWIAGLDSYGYGQVWFEGKTTKAHLLLYKKLVGPIKKGLQLDHLCRQRNCCNPDHLEPVTPKVNTKRGLNHHREKTHCLRGHPLSGANSDVYTPKRGGRQCRTCRREREGIKS